MNLASLKSRLKSIAQEKERTFNEIWKQLVLERFLARLSNSDQQENFIFKGGLLLAQYLDIGRETTDADFLMTKIKSDTTSIQRAMEIIIGAKVKDGFHFSWSNIEELSQPHMEYPGFRITLDANFEQMKDRIKLDIGVGDIVDAVEESFHPFVYNGKPMFAGEISLMVYPVESIFAEKFETITSKGPFNGRMKDYHDVLLMIRENDLLNKKRLKTSLQRVMNHRGTPVRIPLVFDNSGMVAIQKLWGQHLNGLGLFKDKLDLPSEMEAILDEINDWLLENKIFDLKS